MGEEAMQSQKVLVGRFNHLSMCRYGAMLYNINDWPVGQSLDAYGGYGVGELHLFLQLICAGDTVVEVGANIGAHTVFLSRMVGETGKVYAFEPQRIVFQTLCANVALNSLTNVHCFHSAVGDR